MLVAVVFLMLEPGIFITGWPILDTALAFFWIVGITNALNLLDNIDGLAAGVSGIAGTFFLLVLYFGANGTSGPLAIAMAAFVGIAAGFLLYNFHPASIFMGDCGSHLLGSFLACATLVSTSSAGSKLAPVAAIPVVLMLIPIFDTAFVTVSRGLAGRSAFLGGRDHTSHRLVALGIGERKAVLVLYGLTFAGGAVALGLMAFHPGIAWGLVGLYVATLGITGVYLGHIEVSRSAIAATPPPLPSEITNRHRAYEVALDVFLLGAAYYVAFVARFREPQFSEFLPHFTRSLPLVVGLQLTALWASGKYRRVWATFGVPEILSLFRGATLGVAASVIALLYMSRSSGTSVRVHLRRAAGAGPADRRARRVEQHRSSTCASIARAGGRRSSTAPAAAARWPRASCCRTAPSSSPRSGSSTTTPGNAGSGSTASRCSASWTTSRGCSTSGPIACRPSSSRSPNCPPRSSTTCAPCARSAASRFAACDSRWTK